MLAHDLFRKPLRTFRDHALNKRPPGSLGRIILSDPAQLLGKTESIGAREKVKQKVSDALDRATFSEKDHAPRRS
jgi:hypothetical protein